MKVLIVLKHRFELWTAPAWFVEKLRAEFSEATFGYHRAYDTIADDLQDAEIILSWSLSGEQVQAAPMLKWIHSTAAGIHQLLIPEILNRDITITNARSVHGPVVAEHVLALMFALTKKLNVGFRFQQRHEWGQDAMTRQHPPLGELRDATLGIVGVGSIGGYVARVASAMGMRVTGMRANPKKGVDWLAVDDPMRAQHRVYGPNQLDAMLGAADFVVISAPVTSSTEKLIDAHALSLMKPTAYLINVARGALVDEPALIEALREQRIGGAALDVFDEEPLPGNSPLWEMENVIITPHQGGLSHMLWERQYALFSENLRRYRSGAGLIGLVDKRAGY